MTASTQKDRINLSNAKALRRCRELMKVTRNEVAQRLGLSIQAVEKYESGRAIIDEEKKTKFLEVLDLSEVDFQKIKRGKGITRNRKQKTVFTNQERRSYRKVITKEVRVLTIMRKMAKLTQDQASAVCGYSRPSIGHIENGRIELCRERIRHIVTSYGFEINGFEGMMKEEVLRDEIINFCLERIMGLKEDKLRLVQSMLLNLS